jgi:holin-like protein
MIRNIMILLAFQLLGETVSRGGALSVPGPVIGLAALFLTLMVLPNLAVRMGDTANGLLAHLSLLFVPAGVGIIAHLALFAEAGLALAAALIGSTVLAILVAVGAFILTSKLTGAHHDE